jgi:hypothetical protein
VIRIRQGRRNPYALWLQEGDEPDDQKDTFVGSVRYMAHAVDIVKMCELLHDIRDAAEWDGPVFIHDDELARRIREA